MSEEKLFNMKDVRRDCGISAFEDDEGNFINRITSSISAEVDNKINDMIVMLVNENNPYDKTIKVNASDIWKAITKYRHQYTAEEIQSVIKKHCFKVYNEGECGTTCTECYSQAIADYLNGESK